MTDTDAPVVCIAHGAFAPCRKGGEHRETSNPFWVKSVRDYQDSPIEGLTWEPAWETKMPNRAALPDTAAGERTEYERLTGEAPSCRFEGNWEFHPWIDETGPVLICETHGYGAAGLVYALPDPIVGEVGLCRPEADYLYRLLDEEANPVGSQAAPPVEAKS